MWSGSITLQVYVRPPRDFPHNKGELWKMIKLLCGMREAGWQWILKIKD